MNTISEFILKGVFIFIVHIAHVCSLFINIINIYRMLTPNYTLITTLILVYLGLRSSVITPLVAWGFPRQALCLIHLCMKFSFKLWVYHLLC